jgi:hypothetical protein
VAGTDDHFRHGLIAFGAGIRIEHASSRRNHSRQKRDNRDNEQDRAEGYPGFAMQAARGKAGGRRISHDPTRQGDSASILVCLTDNESYLTPEGFGRSCHSLASDRRAVVNGAAKKERLRPSGFHP